MDYGGQSAYGAQAWPEGYPGSGLQPGVAGQPGLPPSPGGPRRARNGTSRAVAVAMLIVGVVGLGASLAGAVMQLLPRQFSAHQRQQILDWEAGQRWRELPAGTIFPARVTYPAPSKLGGALTLHAIRIGIAKQASCPAAADPAVGRVLTRSGCQAMLRATYADATNSFVVTVGVAAFPSAAQANAA